VKNERPGGGGVRRAGLFQSENKLVKGWGKGKFEELYVVTRGARSTCRGASIGEQLVASPERSLLRQLVLAVKARRGCATQKPRDHISLSFHVSPVFLYFAGAIYGDHL